MRTLITTAFVSLDGVIEAPGGEAGHRSSGWTFKDIEFVPEAYELKGREQGEAAAMMMGRVSYEAFSPVWPTMTEDFAGYNAMPKYVVSSTLTDPAWQNTTVISGDVAAGLRAAKDGTDGDLTMSGSATTARWLLANGLLDELALLVHPIAVGSGQRLFEDPTTYPLELLSSETLGTGVLHLRYAPVREAAAG